MASMNYCFTVCRAAEENVQHKNQSNASSSAAIDVPSSSSPGTGAYFFGRYFSFGSTSPSSPSLLTNPFAIKAAVRNDTNDNIS